MGVFFYTKSVALVEDVPLEEKYDSQSSLLSDMEAGFEQVTTRIHMHIMYSKLLISCWIGFLSRGVKSYSRGFFILLTHEGSHSEIYREFQL